MIWRMCDLDPGLSDSKVHPYVSLLLCPQFHADSPI